MNFVELVNDLLLESGASGRTLTTVQGALPLEIARLKKWTRDAWNEIQLKPHYWGFHFIQSSMTVPLNASVLNPPEFVTNAVAEWVFNGFRMSEPGKARKDSYPLTYHDYLEWRNHGGLDLTVSRRPDSITIDTRNDALIISPPSDQAGRTLFYDYWRTPQVLVEDEDVPIMPERFHQLIVGKALRKYGLHESAPEAIAKADSIISLHESALDIDQGIGITTRGLIW